MTPTASTTSDGSFNDDDDNSQLAGAVWLDLVLIVLAVVALWIAPTRMWGDGLERFKQLTELLHSHAVVPGKYSYIAPLFAAPLWFVGGDQGGDKSAYWCGHANLIHLLLGSLICLRRPSLGAMRVRIRFVLLLLTASMFTTHIQHFYGDVFTAVWAAVGMALLLEGAILSGSISLGFAVANTPATLAALAAVVVWRLVIERRLRWLLPLAIAIGLIIVENLWRTGAMFSSAYGDDHGIKTALPYSGLAGFSYPLGFGLLSVCFSLGKGIVFYAPGLLPPIVDRKRVSQVWGTWFMFLLGLIAIYAKWWAWYGGVFWGPRFFLFAAIPAALVLAGESVRFRQRSPQWQFGIVMLLALSAWVGICGYFWSQTVELQYIKLGIGNEPLEWYSPDYAALWFPLITLPPALRSSPLIDWSSIRILLPMLVLSLSAVVVIAPVLTRCIDQVFRQWQAFQARQQGWRW